MGRYLDILRGAEIGRNSDLRSVVQNGAENTGSSNGLNRSKRDRSYMSYLGAPTSAEPVGLDQNEPASARVRKSSNGISHGRQKEAYGSCEASLPVAAVSYTHLTLPTN